MKPRLVLLGPHAREPIQWQAVDVVCRELGLTGVAVAPALVDTINEEHRQLAQVAAPPAGSAFAQLLTLPPGRRLSRATRLLRVLRALDPRVVLLTAEPHERVILDALAALAALRRPVVVGIAAENRVTLPDGPRGRTILQLWRRFDAIAAAGTATVVSFRAAGLPDRVVTEVLGLPVADPEPGSRASRPGRPLRVGYVGRLVPEKGVEELVGAVASIDGVELVLAGPGPLEDALRRRAATDLEGRIELLGLIDRPTLWKVLRGIDVLALLSRSTPGWSEQFGFVLAEAMAVGTPVLGSTSGAIPEVVGDAGLVVDEGSTQAAVDALQRLRDDPGLRSRLAENARARYLAEYSVEAYGRKLAGVIAGRLNERQRRS